MPSLKRVDDEGKGDKGDKESAPGEATEEDGEKPAPTPPGDGVNDSGKGTTSTKPKLDGNNGDDAVAADNGNNGDADEEGASAPDPAAATANDTAASAATSDAKLATADAAATKTADNVEEGSSAEPSPTADASASVDDDVVAATSDVKAASTTPPADATASDTKTTDVKEGPSAEPEPTASVDAAPNDNEAAAPEPKQVSSAPPAVASDSATKQTLTGRHACQAEGCIKYKKARCMGYCTEHFKEFGDPEKVKRVLAEISAARHCKAEGCTKHKIRMGYCGEHYNKNKPDMINNGSNNAPPDDDSNTAKSAEKRAKVEQPDDEDSRSNKRAKLADLQSIMPPSIPSKTQLQKNLKPLFKQKTHVYAAYWPPEDEDREEEPQWYSGTISSYKVSKIPADDKYGYVRYYNVHFDDGDALANIPDHFVMNAEEYLLHMRHDELNEGKKSFAWKGVKNVTDKKSKDSWAKHVGWYVATIGGDKRSFSLLSDALRAYDASVVRKKWMKTKESELNLPEDWGEILFGGSKGKGKKGGTKVSKYTKELQELKAKKGALAQKKDDLKCKRKACTKFKQSGKDGYCLSHFRERGLNVNNKRTASEKENGRICEWEGCTKFKQSSKDGYCHRHFRESKSAKKKRGGETKTRGSVEDKQSIAPLQKKFQAKMTPELSVEPATDIGPLWTRNVTRNSQGTSKVEYVSSTGMRFNSAVGAKEYARLQVVAGTTAAAWDIKKRTPLKWNSDEMELLIKLDETHATVNRSEVYKIMAAQLPRFTQDQCSGKIRALQKKCREGKNISTTIGHTDIKMTLARWTKQEIDLLMKLEDQYKGLGEDAKNEKISQVLPRWDSDKCSFKTLYMRWETRIRREFEAAKAKKRKREEEHDRRIKAKGLAATVGLTTTETIKSDASTPTNKQSFTNISVNAPPGRLGIHLIITGGGNGVIISRVDNDSPLAGTIVSGDQIVGVNGIDVSRKNTTGVVAVFEQKYSLPKTLEFRRVVPSATSQSNVSSESASTPAKGKSEAQSIRAPPESMIDDKFVEMLNNDPYIRSRCDSLEKKGTPECEGKEHSSPVKKGELEDLLSDAKTSEGTEKKSQAIADAMNV